MKLPHWLGHHWSKWEQREAKRHNVIYATGQVLITPNTYQERRCYICGLWETKEWANR